MFTRPKATDSQDEILEMERKFLDEKAKKSSDFKPAAQAIRIPHEKRASIYAQNRKLETPKKSEKDTNIVMADVVERPNRPAKTSINTENRKSGFPKVAKLNIKEAAEGKSLFATSMENQHDFGEQTLAKFLPQLSPDSDRSTNSSIQNWKRNDASEMPDELLTERNAIIAALDPSLVQYLRNRKNTKTSDKITAMEIDEDVTETACSTPQNNLPNTSKGNNLSSNRESSSHAAGKKIEKNSKSHNSMPANELYLNKKFTHASSDDTIVVATRIEDMPMLIDNHATEFNKLLKQNQINDLIKNYDKLKMKESCEEADSRGVSIPIDYSFLQKQDKINPSANTNHNTATPSIATKKVIEHIPAVDQILGESECQNWVNFNIIETEKLEWMKDIPKKSLKPGEQYEARFDWKGVLLPFTEDIQLENRELYLHGDDAFRPGYTLQELFRLSRSKIIQQRLAAFTAIGGILSIYNQGFYDGVLELPLTKIFFLLRFGLDENTPAVVEAVANSMSVLFYNETDEIILDLIADTSLGYLLPCLQVKENEAKHFGHDDMSTNDLNKTKISSAFTSRVSDNDESLNFASMSDFELAEVDLVDCVLRAEILQRIFHIFRYLKLDNSTVASCLKILIRIARTSASNCFKLTTHPTLLNSLFHYFLPNSRDVTSKTSGNIYYNPQYLVLKLFRIIMSQNSSFCIQLLSKGLMERVKNYLCSKSDVKGHIIKLQIESLRILRVIMMFQPQFTSYQEFIPQFAFFLEWHYQHLVYSGEGSTSLIKQHASALLNTIACGQYYRAGPVLSTKIIMCSSKWFHMAKKHGIEEFSQSVLLSSCLNCVTWAIQSGDESFFGFIENFLKVFLNDAKFADYIKNLNCSSVLLKTSRDRRNVFPALPNLGTILTDKNNQPQLIISQMYPVYLLNDIFKLSEILMAKNNNLILNCFIKIDTIETLTKYMKEISFNINKMLSVNFMAKSEIKLICKLLFFNGFDSILTKAELLQAAFNLLTCMTSEHVLDITKIFSCVIFNSANLEFDPVILKKWKDIYLETFVNPHAITISPEDNSFVMPYFPEPILPIDWPYMLLKSVLHKYLHPSSRESSEISELSESQIIEISFTFTHLLRKDINIITPIEELMYYMISFMSKDSDFLLPKLKALLKEQIMYFFNANKDHKFNFDGTFEGKSKFENLYILFLDHFQAASYGDDLFSALVMIPLAQKYDLKWRKKVWSEHAAVLRFIKCDENSQLMGSLEAYLWPFEKDLSLVKCYAKALQCNLLRENSIPYKIARHHVEMFQKNSKLKLNR